MMCNFDRESSLFYSTVGIGDNTCVNTDCGGKGPKEIGETGTYVAATRNQLLDHDSV